MKTLNKFLKIFQPRLQMIIVQKGNKKTITKNSTHR